MKISEIHTAVLWESRRFFQWLREIKDVGEKYIKNPKNLLTFAGGCGILIELPLEAAPGENNFEKKLKKRLTILPRCGNINKLSLMRRPNFENFIV